MKIGIFTDPHYSSAQITCEKRHNSQSLRKIREALEYFSSQECDLILCLGDLTDTESTHEQEAENLTQIARIMDSTPVPVLCLMGNHDAQSFTDFEFYSLLGEHRRPRPISNGHVHLLFIDACYSRDGKRYLPGEVDWTDTFFPHTAALSETPLRLDGSIYLFMHQNIDPGIREDHLLANAENVRNILETCNHVKVVFQGHYHPGHRSEINGIRYITLPAMCENEGMYWISNLE